MAETGVVWITWVFQVMPLFFVVGGVGNAAALDAARERGTPLTAWVRARSVRLARPALPLLVLWAGVLLVAPLLGAPPELLAAGAGASVVVLWFLATYLVVVALAPWTLRLWRRHGWASVAAVVVASVAIDVLGRRLGVPLVGYLAFPVVFGGVGLLGHAWWDGRLVKGPAALGLVLVGSLALAVLIGVFDYPPAMVGGGEEANTAPPTAALLALGVVQTGLVRVAYDPLRRALARPGARAGLDLASVFSLPTYLWHMTTMVAVAGILATLGWLPSTGPETASWWLQRPAWFAVNALVVLPVVRLALPGAARAHRRSIQLGALPTVRVASGVGALAFAAAYAALEMPDGAGSVIAVVPALLAWSGTARPGPTGGSACRSRSG